MNYLVGELSNPNVFAIGVVQLSGIADKGLRVSAVEVEGDSINLITKNQEMFKVMINFDQLGNQSRLGRNQPSNQDQPGHSCKREIPGSSLGPSKD